MCGSIQTRGSAGFDDMLLVCCYLSCAMSRGEGRGGSRGEGVSKGKGKKEGREQISILSLLPSREV